MKEFSDIAPDAGGNNGARRF